jgi:hypothetical protein
MNKYAKHAQVCRSMHKYAKACTRFTKVCVSMKMPALVC